MWKVASTDGDHQRRRKGCLLERFRLSSRARGCPALEALSSESPAIEREPASDNARGGQRLTLNLHSNYDRHARANWTDVELACTGGDSP